MPAAAETRRLRAQKAAARRWHPDDDHSDLDGALFEQRVRALADQAPPLTVAQADRLAAILRGVVAEGHRSDSP